MYPLNLTESHAPATPEGNILEHSVGSLLVEQVTRNGTQPALQEICQDGSSGRTWTYTELHNDARRLASWLSERYAAGEKVVVWSPNSPEWVLMEYGCALAGVVLDKSVLHRHCRGLLSPQKTPTIWVQVESFPMTGSGKVQKFYLREDFLAGRYQTLEA